MLGAFELEGSAANVLSESTPARVVAILGMHRSGTSCLTGSLQEAGLSLGEIHTWNPHNLKGNRENQQFVDLHDAILEANGGAWDNPPKKEIVWSDEHIASAKALLADHASEAVFGFKDPRALLVLEGWKTLVPDLEFVGIFRHPNSVARSLEKRSSKVWEETWDLWHKYNTIMLQEYKKNKFPILDFDDHESILDEKIFHVAGQMGLNEDSGEQKFYSSELKSSVDLVSRTPPWRIRRLHKRLKKVGL
ncbi:MAG: hypothetical protein ACI9JM_003375 [Halioglobus sp.]|jgi:hypothetical protein